MSTRIDPGCIIDALNRIAGIKADDGDTLEAYDERTVLRVEMTAGDLRAVRDAVPAALALVEAFGALHDFMSDTAERGDEYAAIARAVLSLQAVQKFGEQSNA